MENFVLSLPKETAGSGTTASSATTPMVVEEEAEVVEADSTAGETAGTTKKVNI